MKKQIYLIHSSDAAWVGRRREQTIDELVPREMREENLREFVSTTNQALKLADVLPEVLSELSTIPMFGGRQVVVVHNLSDFLTGGRKSAGAKGKKKKAGAKGKKKLTPVEAFAAFVEKDLPSTDNVVIFSNVIEMERGWRIDEKSALYKLVKPPVGEIMKPARKETDPIFLMSNALLRRDAVQCVRHFRAIYRDDARGRIFHEILKNVRFLLQAKVLKMVEKKGTSRDIIDMKYLPDDRRLNLHKQHAFVQKKINDAAHNFQLRELIEALEKMLHVNRWLIPSQKDAYVPDVQLLLETFIIGFCEGKGQGARK